MTSENATAAEVEQPQIQEKRQEVGAVEGDPHLPGRRPTPTVDIGGVKVGSRHPIVVQSMTNTDTADADATALQVAALAHAGSELVRITVNNDAAAAAVPEIRRKLDGLGVEHSLELFDGKHGGISYRYPGAIRELIVALAD